MCAKAEPTVLAVRLISNGALYIVERVKRGLYSLSKLARWVHEGNLVVAVKGWHGADAVKTSGSSVDETCTLPSASDWWQDAQIDEPVTDVEVGAKSAGLDIAVVFGPSEIDLASSNASFVGLVEHRSQSLAPSRSFNGTEAGSFTFVESQGVGHAVEPMGIDGADSNVIDVQQSPEELLNGMREHYLQALYVSKVIIFTQYLGAVQLTTI